MPMHKHLVTLLLFVACSPVCGWSQNSSIVQVPDLYRTLIGNWTGASHIFKDGKAVTEIVNVSISEEPTKHRLRLEFTFPEPNKDDHATKFLELDPRRDILKYEFKGEPTDRYKAVGLKDFAQTGYGDFSGTSPTGEDSTAKNLVRIAFHVQRETLAYEWSFAADGQTFKPYSVFKFKRRA